MVHRLVRVGIFLRTMASTGTCVGWIALAISSAVASPVPMRRAEGGLCGDHLGLLDSRPHPNAALAPGAVPKITPIEHASVLLTYALTGDDDGDEQYSIYY